MTILNATEARSRLYSLIDETAETHEPIVITGKRGTQSSFPKMTGTQSERPCTFFLYPGCGNRSRRDLPSLQRVVQRNLIGELGACLYKAGSKGCEEAG